MSTDIQSVVREKYGDTARSSLSNHDAGVRAIAQAFGYSPEELAAIPAGANMGLSCGNPTAFAGLKDGEVVVDLGCGGGLDVFLAAGKVGPTGRAIGIDMTPDMIERARRNAAAGPDGRPVSNVEFHLATIDHLPLPDASADAVISNCVINLATDKPAVFREIARILKPGGRVAVSDIALKAALPEELAQSVAAHVGCIAGAVPIEVYRQGLIDAGLRDVVVVDAGKDLNAYGAVEGQSACCAPPDSEPASDIACGTPRSVSLTTSACCGGSVKGRKALHADLAEILERYDINRYAASVKVYALKPR